jgi:O-antigen/teichoic acid export membrane protein
VAIYSLAYKIASVLKLVIVDSIKMAVIPVAMQKIDSPDSNKFFSKTLLYSSFVVMLGIIGISLFSFEIIKFITGSKEYWSSFYVVPLLSLSVFFLNMRETCSWGLIITKKTRIMGMNAVAAGILNIVLNILLIPKWNITGAALATVATQFIYWTLNYYFSQKEYSIPYEVWKVALLFLVGGVLSFSGLLMTNLEFLPRFLIKTACLISFPFLLNFFNFYEPVEIEAIKGFVRKWSDVRMLKENLMSLKDIKDED